MDEIDIPDKKPTAEMNIMAAEVLSSLMRLPAAQRETAALAYVEGYTYQEVSEMLGVPIGTVMSRLSTVRKKLSDEFADSNHGNETP